MALVMTMRTWEHSQARILLGSLAGVFLDRWDRRRTMIAADLGRADVLVPLLLVRSPQDLWLIYSGHQNQVPTLPSFHFDLAGKYRNYGNLDHTCAGLS